MRRIWRWEGFVEEVCEDSIWVRLTPIDHKGHEISGEFDRSYLSNAIEGRYITLYLYKKGKKARLVMREKKLPPLTQEQLDQIKTQAKRQFMLIKGLAE